MSVCSGRGYCAVGGAIVQWAGLLCSGWGYCAVGGAIVQWVGLLCSGWGYCAVGGAIVRWAGLLWFALFHLLQPSLGASVCFEALQRGPGQHVRAPVVPCTMAYRQSVCL